MNIAKGFNNKCPHCKKEIGNNSEFLRDVKHADRMRRMPFYCPLCKKVFYAYVDYKWDLWDISIEY